MFSLVMILVLVGCSSLAASAGITVTPAMDSTVPMRADENITYSCTVDGDRQAIWEINNRQISGQRARDDFSIIGVIVTGVLGSRTTEVTFTPQGRETYLALNQSSIPIRCTAFDNNRPVTDFGEIYNVVIYDVPVAPPKFSFNPDPDSLSRLTLSWGKPPGVPDGVQVTYLVIIAGPRVNVNVSVTDTMYQFDDSMDESCEEHSFSVQAVNPAGPGGVATMEETIPISPDIRVTSDRFQVTSIDLSSNGGVRISVNFPLGRTCSTTTFPISNYSVIISEVGVTQSYVAKMPLPITDQSQSLNMPVVLDNLPGVAQDKEYEIFVQACISIACRNTTRVRILTSDVQQASMYFHRNNIFMNCSFADSVSGRGCIFNLSLVNGSELFYLRREDNMASVVSQCNVSSGTNMAYTSFVVMDWESDGRPGPLPIPLERPPDVMLESNYTQLTGCTIPSGGLSGGTIAGIVLVVMIAIAGIVIAIAIVVAVVGYKLRTGKWFKLKLRDEEQMTVVFERALLMEDDEPKVKRSFSLKKTFSIKSEDRSVVPKEKTLDPQKSAGSDVSVPSSPDGIKTQESVTIQPDAALVPSAAAAFTANPPASTVTLVPNLNPDPNHPTPSVTIGPGSMDFTMVSPKSAFTLDFVDDKKVRLHLNRGLIRQVLKQNKITSPGQKAKTSASKASNSSPIVNVPMTSVIRVKGHEVDLDSYEIIDLPSIHNR